MIKRVIKGLLCVFFGIPTIPLVLLSWFGTHILKSELLFAYGSQAIAMVPSLIGSWARVFYYWATIDSIQLDSVIGFGTILASTKIRAKRVIIGDYAIVGYSEIGQDVVIASRVSVIAGGHQHNFSDPTKGVLEVVPIFECIHLGEQSFLGEASIIMANIGERCIIGAGSVVVKDIPPYSLAVGNPARVVKSRRPGEQTNPADTGRRP
jgi:virginiamycin A acetyltransferase